MKMMSCIFDDEELSSASNSSMDNIQHGNNAEKRLNFKSRFIKKQKPSTNQSNSSPVKVQRSASAILRSKMYAVVAKKRKVSKPDTNTSSHQEKNKDLPGKLYLE